MTQEAADRLARARIAQVQWETIGPKARARKLQPLRIAIAERMDDIVRVISVEVGKPPMDALAGDVMVTLEQLRHYEKSAAHILRPKNIGKLWIFYSGTRFLELREPHGVVLVCAPWNYPLQLAVVPMATALFAGNAVILKCSENTPRTADLIKELCEASGLPKDLVQVSHGGPEEAAALLEARPDFVFFTGSSKNGRKVAARAGELMIPSLMELGGKDAALVFDSCDVERSVSGLLYGSFSNSGQVCVGVRRIYVQQGIYSTFLHEFLQKLPELRIGTEIESDVGPVVMARVRHHLQLQVDDALARGAKLHTTWQGAGESARPAVLTDVPADASLMAEESFGPVVCIAPFETETEGLRKANGTAFALSASVWTGDKAQGKRVALQLNGGSCGVNDVIRNIGNPYAAFGGNGASGYGRYHGTEGLLALSRVKTVMTATRLRRSELHWYPFRAKMFSQLRGVLRLRHCRSFAEKMKAFRAMWIVVVLLTSGFCFADSVSAGEGGALTIEVKLPEQARGEIAYLVFAGPEGFPDVRAKAIRHQFVPVMQSGGVQRINVGELPPGRYALSVYLDENGNHKLDKNWLGIPREAVGASNNPQNHMAAPRFNDCAFAHGTAAESISITLVR